MDDLLDGFLDGWSNYLLDDLLAGLLDELLDTTRGDDTILSSLFAYFLKDGCVLLATFLIDPEGPLDFKQHALFKSADHPMMLYVREFLAKQLDTSNNEHVRLEAHLGENNTQRGCFASISWPASENPEEIFQAAFGMLMECNAFYESGSYPWLGVHRKNSQRMTANGFCMTALPNLVFSPLQRFHAFEHRHPTVAEGGHKLVKQRRVFE